MRHFSSFNSLPLIYSSYSSCRYTHCATLHSNWLSHNKYPTACGLAYVTIYLFVRLWNCAQRDWSIKHRMYFVLSLNKIDRSPQYT